MKLAIFLFVTSFTILSASGTLWRDIKGPMDSPKYAEIVSKLYANQQSVDQRKLEGKVANGSRAKLGDFPYQVYMYLYSSDGSAWLCGGSIIHKRWILTAAHCVDGVVKVEVFVGAINRYQDGRAGSFIKMITVTRNRSIIPHPSYNADEILDDIGLVELPEEAPIENSYIGLLALPRGSDLTRNLVGLQGTVSGFGRRTDDPFDVNPDMNYITLPIADNSVCQTVFGSSSVTVKNVCLQSVNRGSACSGDSGGPLTVNTTNGEKMQIGIVSFGAAVGCELGYPQVFTRVTSYLAWIEAATGIRFD